MPVLFLSEDYGLLKRRLSLDVEYHDTPFTLSHAEVPVFTVGRNQLYQLFGLQGYECPRRDNVYCSLEYSDLEHASFALVCLGGEWSNSDVCLHRLVCLCDVYESFEQANMHVRLALELDAEKALKYPRCHPIYSYEVWQICDDHDLWWEWESNSQIYWSEELREQELYETADGPHFYPTVAHKPVLMSEDYLSSLKTANASRLEQDKRETCYFCGCFLPGKNFAVQYSGEMKLVCRACFDLYNAHDHDGLRYRTIDTFICDCCGRTMKHKYYVDSSIGTYCAECKKQDSDLGEYFVCDRCGKRLPVDQLGHTVEGTYCKDCRYELIQGLWGCYGDCCDPDKFPDPTCHGCEWSNLGDM